MEHKVFLVTGASSGIGAGIARCLARAGATKLVLVARRQDRLEEVAQACKEAGAADVLTISKDLLELETLKSIIDESTEHFGRLDVLINNAGLAKMKMLQDADMEHLRHLMNINYLSPAALTKEALPHIRKAKGSIIFISSVAAKTPYKACTAYGASKAAITQFAKILALEEAPHEVRVNCISPGGINTEMMEKATQMKGDALDAALSKLQPLSRAGQPEDVGKAVLYLVGADFVTGEDLVVDGGYTLSPNHHRLE